MQDKVLSYLGTSASFVGGVFAIRAAGGGNAMVTGAIQVDSCSALVGLGVHPQKVSATKP